MAVLKSTDELDAIIRQADAATTDDALRAVLGSFSYELNYDNLDPFSAAYREFVLRQYEAITGKPYGFENERTTFDLERAVLRPFPFSTGSCATTGDYLVAFGHLLKNLNIRPGARVADMGPGWAVTTAMLGSMNFDVTAIEVDPQFCELTRRRTAAFPSVRTVQTDFLGIERQSGIFDAVIFFECFHHCLDHVELLRVLHRKTAPDGVLIFGGEPISPHYTFPWGLRPDGMAIWSVRKFGWLELGLSEAYFLEALKRTGWQATTHPLTGYPNAFCYRATKTAP
jgi:2-polyprenyl-3-methyl-5-hydroxy-6-metoxy-1,4-benzoquinol methylase